MTRMRHPTPSDNQAEARTVGDMDLDRLDDGDAHRGVDTTSLVHQDQAPKDSMGRTANMPRPPKSTQDFHQGTQKESNDKE